MEPIQIKLSQQDLDAIRELTKKGFADVRVVKRALILKSRHLGLGTNDIVELLDVDPGLIPITLKNFLEFGLKVTIEDSPRTGRPIIFDDRDKANIVALVCSPPPEGYARWTLDLIEEEYTKAGLVDSISKSTIRAILEEHELKPWQEKMWCIPKLDEEYIKKMEDVLSVYEKPYDESSPVVCLDEKLVELRSETRKSLESFPGNIAKKDYEYKRNGTGNVFCAVEPLKGQYFNKVTPNRTREEFAKFINEIAEFYSHSKKIILVMDNLNTHTEKSLFESFGEEKGKKIWNRFEVHDSPKHGSWLNQAEIAIGMFTRQCLGSGDRVGTLEDLKRMTEHWNKSTNEKRPTIEWKFNREKARKKLKYENPAS